MKTSAVQLLLETLRLRGGLSGETAQSSWSNVNTRGLVRLVEFEGAELWLDRRLRQMRTAVPDAFGAELRRLVLRTSALNMQVDAQTLAMAGLLSRHGIAWSLLKGQARRAAVDRYSFADARSLADVDLLVPERDADAAWQLLLANGFRRVYEEPTPWKVVHHRPTLIDASNVSVELHITTGATVAPSEAWRRATDGADEVTWSGLRTAVPNATELVWQALTHGVADGVRGYTLKSFLSVAAVLAAQPVLDWELMATRLASGEVVRHSEERPVPGEQVRRWLAIAASLAGTTLPTALAPRVTRPLLPLLVWRGGVLSSQLAEPLQGRLFEESARVEVGLPLSPAVEGRGWWRAARRRTSSAVARTVYSTWRAVR